MFKFFIFEAKKKTVKSDMSYKEQKIVFFVIICLKFQNRPYRRKNFKIRFF